MHKEKVRNFNKITSILKLKFDGSSITSPLERLIVLDSPK